VRDTEKDALDAGGLGALIVASGSLIGFFSWRNVRARAMEAANVSGSGVYEAMYIPSAGSISGCKYGVSIETIQFSSGSMVVPVSRLSPSMPINQM